MESINEILLQIHKSQKKLRVKITVFLKKLEEILFKKREKLDQNGIRLLLVGDREKIGLLQICGIRSKYKGSLKNSSYYCIKLLYKVLTEHFQKKDILKIFQEEFDEEEFLTMKLASHIMSDKKNDDIAYQIARLIKEKRPHLDVKTYIPERVPKEKFEEWMKQYKSSQAQRQINQKEWKDQEGDEGQQSNKNISLQFQIDFILTQLGEGPKISDDFRPSNVRKRDEKKMKKQKYFQEVHLKNFQQNVEYYKMTFQDPLAIQDEDDLRKSKAGSKSTKREADKTKQKLKQVFNKKICKPEDIMKIIKMNSDGGEIPALDEVIQKIHIESPDFEPVVFLSLFHTKTPNEYLVQASRQLGKEQIKGLSLNKVNKQCYKSYF